MMKKFGVSSATFILAPVILLASTGCGAGGDTDQTSFTTPSPVELESLHRDLTLGSMGEDVRALHAYLHQYGYLPNDSLSLDYPAWRAIVPQAPENETVFDEHTAAAVLALQANMSLPKTGIVDAATRAILKQPRCGVPEGMPHLDPSDKFALYSSKWNKSTLTYSVTNPNDVTLAAARQAIANAFSNWGAQTSLAFTQVLIGTHDIDITFASIDGPNNAAARTGSPAAGGDMVIDTAENWSVATVTPAGSLDLQTVVLHELGHAFGLDHSSVPGATMFPTISLGTQDHSLSLDDKVAIGSIYDKFVQLPGAAKDIAIGSGTTLSNGGTWIIGTNPFGDGFQVYKWNGSDWDATDGGAARIAVDSIGNPWVVGASGTIYHRTSSDLSTGGWVVIPGAARDIAAGANATIWIIGTNPTPGGFGIFKWNGLKQRWDADAAGGGAVKIAVGPDGVPWVTNSSNQIFRRTSSDPTTGSWTRLPGVSNDIAVNVGNYAWRIAPLSSGGANVAVWDEQAALSQGSVSGSAAPTEAKWAPGRQVGAGGANEAVAVDPQGRPWVVDNNGAIFMTAWGPWRF